MYVHDDARTVECAVCGIKGSFVAKDGKLVFVYPVEQLDHAHNTPAGRSKHVDVVGEVEAAFATTKAADEYGRRAKMYKDFIKASRPGE